VTNEQRVRASWDRVWSRGDVGYATEFYAPTFRKYGEAVDAAEFAEGARTWQAKFEGFGATVDRLFTVENGVVTQVTYRGRQIGDLQRVPATGKDTEVTGLDVFLFEDGRCIEHLHEADHYTMFVQLGAPPTPEAK
jgi:predicted ester cyclase